MDRIGIIDADLLGRSKHRFPNLACEKLSGYWKSKGAHVSLLRSYAEIPWYNIVYVSKVFTDTPVPDNLTSYPNVKIGGTGFFFDKAPPLPCEVEHHFPDYHLYDAWIAEKIAAGAHPSEFKEYTDYAVGFLTRGCFRKCKFCVNQKYDRVFSHSPLSEFYDGSQKKICLLDDNFFGNPSWKSMLQELIATGKPFKFKQGLDERLLTDEKCGLLFSAKYDGDFTFAFDNVKDYALIERQLKLIRRYSSSESIKFYVLVGFESTDATDIENALLRIALLRRYKCLPYIMRYQSATDAPWTISPYRGMYVNLARWCNQPGFFRKKSFRQFCELDQSLRKSVSPCSSMRALTFFEAECPSATPFFDQKYGESV